MRSSTRSQVENGLKEFEISNLCFTISNGSDREKFQQLLKLDAEFEFALKVSHPAVAKGLSVFDVTSSRSLKIDQQACLRNADAALLVTHAGAMLNTGVYFEWLMTEIDNRATVQCFVVVDLAADGVDDGVKESCVRMRERWCNALRRIERGPVETLFHLQQEEETALDELNQELAAVESAALSELSAEEFQLRLQLTLDDDVFHFFDFQTVETALFNESRAADGDVKRVVAPVALRDAFESFLETRLTAQHPTLAAASRRTKALAFDMEWLLCMLLDTPTKLRSGAVEGVQTQVTQLNMLLTARRDACVADISRRFANRVQVFCDKLLPNTHDITTLWTTMEDDFRQHMSTFAGEIHASLITVRDALRLALQNACQATQIHCAGSTIEVVDRVDIAWLARPLILRSRSARRKQPARSILDLDTIDVQGIIETPVPPSTAWKWNWAITAPFTSRVDEFRQNVATWRDQVGAALRNELAVALSRRIHSCMREFQAVANLVTVQKELVESEMKLARCESEKAKQLRETLVDAQKIVRKVLSEN